ncbi:tetratricopeptide repeat protein 6 [Gavia stellata]|uniref:tetratricopeptide repeat protein 6 n=1 Tax=Gavia stellata TaxID=37040 RepID=UPI00289F5CE3|nr:tetratricopeptide repeat protein 6 [Gavia stellata]
MCRAAAGGSAAAGRPSGAQSCRGRGPGAPGALPGGAGPAGLSRVTATVRLSPALYEAQEKVRISSEVKDMKKQTPDLRVITQRNKSVEEDSADKNQTSCSEKVSRENATCSYESTVVKLPVIASFAGTTKKIVMVRHPAPSQKPSYCRSNFHVNSSPISLEKTKAVSKVKNRVHMLQMDPQNLKRDKTAEIDTVIRESDEFSSTDSDTSKNISRKGKITRESCKKRSSVISKAKQQDLDVESVRVLRKRSKQPSVRSAREQLEEARDVTRPDISKIYEKNFQQSKPEEPTSTPALPVKVVARSIDEIIASLQSTSPSPSDQTIKELLESVLGQNYNIKTEQAPIEYEEIKTESQVLPSFHQASLKTPVVQKESQAAENESRPKDELLTYNKQVKQAPSSDVLQVEGKAISKIKPNEVQKELQKEYGLQQSLPPQASNVKGQHYPSIHRLCTAFPSFILPPYLQLVSRVYHTLDRRGHNILFTAEDTDNKEEETMCSKCIYLKEQSESKRIYYEGVPISEQFQNNRMDGIHFLPPHTSKNLTERQKVAEYCLKKPQLQLLGEKSNVIEDVVFEDFFTDHEELEAEQDDHDFYDYGLVKHAGQDALAFVLERSFFDSDYGCLRTKSLLRRCQSLPDFSDSESSETSWIKGSVSALEMTAFQDETTLNMSDNFKTSMEELKVMKQQIAEPDVGTEIGKSSPTKHPLNQICDDLQSMQTDIPAEKMPTLTGQEDSENDIVLAERPQKTGIKYTVFPRRKKTKKSKKIINTGKLEVVTKKLSQPPKILKRSMSLGRLPIHDKFSIKVSSAINQYQSPSIPCLLDFEKFAEVRGGIPKQTCACIGTASEEKDTELLKGTEMVASQEANLQIELVDSIQPVLLEGATVTTEDLEKEVRRLTELIEKEEHPSAFHYCRRGAIQRKLGKLKSAMDDLEKAISLEPLLLNAYWHRHLIYLFQDRISAALDDLHFITKWSKNKADTYLSMAEIYRKQGDNTLAIISYSSAIQCSPTDDDIYFRRAELYFEENKLLLAMDDYTKCFQYNPKRTDALMKHGIHFFDCSVLTTAIQDFTAVINEDPSNAQARLYRGRAYAKQQQYGNAIQDLGAAVHLDPSCWLAFYYRGCILRQIDPKRAVQDFSVSVLINDTQKNLRSFLHRGIIYSEQCQWSLAICDFESVLALDSSVISAYLNIGLILLLHLNQCYEAIRQFTNAIETDPLNVRAYVCRALAYHKINNLPNAVKDINRAIHLYPNKSQLCILRGQYLMELKKYELASLCVHQLAEMDEGNPVQQALIQSFCQNHNTAIECLREATATQPEPSVFVILGKIQMKAKKTKDAVRSFKKAMKLLMTSVKILPNTFEAAEMYYLTGLCYMEQKSLLQACDAFSTAIRLHSSYPDAFYQRGLCRMQLRQAKCIQDFNRALALCPSHFQAYMSRAAYYGSKGRYSKAILNCNEAIKILPNSVRAYFYRGTLKYQNKTFKTAIEDLSKTIDLNKTCILAYYNRAVCYHQLKDFRKALKDYGILLLLELSKEIAFKVLINRGLLYMELGDYANACEDFKEATLLNPDDSQIFQAIGICYHKLHEFEEAVRSFDQVLKLDPISVGAYVGRGNSYMENGHEVGRKRAQKDFLRAIHLNPRCVKARICLGYNLQALGKFQRAWRQFTVAICIDPKCHAAYDGRASVCLQMGETFAAFQDTNAALQLTTTAPLLTNRGVINQLMGYLPCAMKDYQQAISVDPNYALAYFNAANIYFFNRQFSQAYCYYSKVLQLDPRNESAVMNRAITNTLLNNIEEAKEDFEKAISLCPFSAAVYFNRANFYNGLKQYELAEKDISTALSIQPNDALMYKFRADIRGKLGFNKEAVEDYKQAISIQEQIDSM